MKKYIFILTLLFTFCSTYGQDDEFEPITQFGIKQGVNYSSVLFSPRINQGLKLGYNGGLVFKYKNEKLFALQVEFNYAQKGWSEDLDTINNSYERNLNYVELPFMTHVYWGKRALKYYVNLGSSVGYLVGDLIQSEINEELYTRPYYENEIDNRFDFNAFGGLGITLDTKIGEFQAGFRYAMTLTDIFKYTSESFFEDSQNQIISFSITYYFLDSRKE
ncbi:MAG: porin family protein [Bacteroidota bacterium]